MPSPFDLLLREGRINEMVLSTRVITGPMERGLANADGTMTQRYIDYLVERARGGASLIIVESTYVDARGMGHRHQLGCHGDHVIPGLRRLADAIHAEGSRVGLELYAGGRQTQSVVSQRQPIAPSVVPCAVLQPTPVPRALSTAEIEDVIRSFADAARRTMEAGIDMIHLHGAHGYLIGSFLSPFSNKRDDAYGGSLENRARLPLDVLAAVREVVGPRYPIGYRISADEYVEGGLTVEDAAVFARLLQAAGIDLIDVSGGIYESSSTIIQGPEAPRGGFVAAAARIKAAVGPHLPVSVTQRLNAPEFANRVMAEHGIDFISMSRAFHADPHFVRKLVEDRTKDILPCIACHHCTNLLEADEPAGCAANPYSTFERRRPGSALRHRQIAVVGGGPGGLHAARLLARQGHRVVLYEREGELGGQMRYSSRVSADYGGLVTYLVRQIHSLGVEIHTGTEVDRTDGWRSGLDAIVIATGAGPGVDFWEWDGAMPRFDLFTALDRAETDWQGRAAVLGGDSASCFAAMYLAGRGVDVDLIAPGNVLAGDKLSPGRDRLEAALEGHPKVRLHRETTVERIAKDRLTIQHRGNIATLDGIDAVVVGGRTSQNGLYESLIAEPSSAEVFVIGDAIRPRDVYAAAHEAADVVGILQRSAAGR